MGEEQRSLWVGSLPTDVTTDEIREKFSKCGKIDEVFIGPRKSHEQYVYCFVHFRDGQGFENAMRLREDELMLRSQLLRLKKGLNRQHSRAKAYSWGDRGSHRDKNAWRDDRNDRSRRDWDGNGRDGRDGRDGRWRKEPPKTSQFWWDAGASGSSHPMKLQVKAGYEERRIYVGNLPAKVTEDDIRHHFHTFGEIEFVSLKHKTKEQESFCFLGFDSAGAASSAIRQMDGSDAWGSPIKVTLSKPPERKGSNYHRSVEYSDAPRDEGRRRRSRSRRSSRSSSRRPSPGRRSYGASRARPQTRSPGNENSRALLNRPPKEASANRSEKSYSDRESYSDEESEAREVAPEPRAAAPAPEEPKAEEDQGAESSASSSSSEGEEPEKPTRSSAGRAEEATPARAPQAEAEDEAPSSTIAEGANDAGGRGVVKRRKRRRVNADGQPERRMKRRRKLPAGNKEAVPLETRSRSRTPASPMRPTSPTNERASSPRSEPPEDAAPREPLPRKRPEKRGEEKGIRVRVENLPSDMTLSELKNTALDFGEVSELKLWKMSDGSKTGHVTFEEGTDVARVLQKLDNRRVEGWDRRLKCYTEQPPGKSR